MEELADPPAAVETSSSTAATAVVSGTAGFETDRLPWTAAELHLLLVVVASYSIDEEKRCDGGNSVKSS